MIACGRRATLLAALKAIRALSRGDHRAQARRRWAASSMTAPIPDDLEDGIVGKGFPIEVYNVLGAGDAFMSGFLRGWLARRDPRDLRRPGPMPAAPSPCRACSARRNIRPGRSCSSSSSTAARTGRCARTRRSTTSTGRRRAGREIAAADGARHRPPRRSSRTSPTGRRRPRERIARLQGLAVKAAARVAGGRAGLRHAARRAAMAARRCSIRAAQHFSGSAGRWSCRARGRCASSSRRTSARSSSNGRSTTASSACASTIPTIPPTLKAEQQREAAHAVRGRAQGRPRAADRDHRRQARPARRRHDRRARWRSSTRSASSRTGGSSSRRPRPRPGRTIEAVIDAQRSLLPRHRAARPRGAAGRAGSGLRRDRRCTDGQGLRRRPHHLRRRGASSGWPAG